MTAVGITATRDGLTGAQVYQLSLGLDMLEPTEAHHGDCIGGDAQFHEICLDLGIPIHIHPPEDDKRRAFCEHAAVVNPPAPYLTRNRAIVNESDCILACPKEDTEPEPARGQGTWSTIRHAKKVGVPMMIIWPDGRVEEVNT